MDIIDVYYYAGNGVKPKSIKRLIMKNDCPVTIFIDDVTRLNIWCASFLLHLHIIAWKKFLTHSLAYFYKKKCHKSNDRYREMKKKFKKIKKKIKHFQGFHTASSSEFNFIYTSCTFQIYVKLVAPIIYICIYE